MIDERIAFGDADVGELKLHYAIAGKGERLVILLHGFPEFWYSWRHQLVALADDYTVVAPDMRSYNLSDRPGNVSDYTIDHLADDVARLIRHFGRDQAAVVGHDWGAAVAWNFAFTRPELVWKLAALQVPPAFIWKRNQTLRQYLASWYMFFFQLPFLPELVFTMNDFAVITRSLRRSTSVPDVFTDADFAIYKDAWSQTGAPSAMINYYRANVSRARLRAQDRKIDVPTLFIYGEKDQAVLPKTVAGIRSVVTGEYVEHRIPGSGHWVQQEAADEVTEVLRRFLAD
jgi:pimeloyl-ACP methyl ester carboxylesterase